MGWHLFESFGGWRHRKKFTTHFMRQNIGLNSDQFQFVLRVIEVYELKSKAELVEKLEEFNYYRPRLETLAKDTAMVVPPLKPIIKAVKNRLPEVQ